MPDEPIIFDFSPEKPAEGNEPAHPAEGEPECAVEPAEGGPDAAAAIRGLPPIPAHAPDDAATPTALPRPQGTPPAAGRLELPFAMTSRHQSRVFERMPASPRRKLAYGVLSAVAALAVFATIVLALQLVDRSMRGG